MTQKLIGITQRIFVDHSTKERRDCLDQRWSNFFDKIGMIPFPIPNSISLLKKIFEQNIIDGVVLSGGNSLFEFGGDAPERDETELLLLKYCETNKIPILGVCRGMQIIQRYFGVPLIEVKGHVTSQLKIQFINDLSQIMMVNSYHHFGAIQTVPDLKIMAKSEDGVVKYIKHKDKKITAIMWHPERELPFSEFDLEFFQEFFL